MRREKIWASPSKIPGEKESGNTIRIFHWRSLCVCMHLCMYMCVCVCVCVFVTADYVCDIHITLSYFQSICDAN